MTDPTKDLALAIVSLQKLSEETLPKALEIKKRLDQGEKLDHWDIEFLKELYKHAEEIRPMVDKHPEYQDIYARTVHLYREIADEAVRNESQSANFGI